MTVKELIAELEKVEDVKYPDVRTAEEWKQWATAKIKDNPRRLTSEEIDNMELGDCIEFDTESPFKQKILRGEKPLSLPPNFIAKG